MGGAVLLGEQWENLCRPATQQEKIDLGGFAWVVEAQGLPNLIHEIVHALYLGKLEDDHGFDYSQIPLDIERPEHRKHLWEELACCGLSTTTCAPHQPGPSRGEPERFAREWFAEQFEIQGVFHGLEDDLRGLRAHVDRQMTRPDRAAELAATVERGHQLLCEGLLDVGGPGSLPPCDVMALWRDYRESWP